MTFSFHAEAEAELSEAIEYYENRESGLGYDFSSEVLPLSGTSSAFQPLAGHGRKFPALSCKSFPVWNNLQH
jgi:hypothetical protein